MSDLRAFADSLKAAADAIDNHAAISEQATQAEARAKDAHAAAAKAKDEAALARQQTELHMKERLQHAAKVTADLDAAHKAHKRRMDAATESADQQIKAAADVLTGLQVQIRARRAELDMLNTQSAKLKAAFDEAAGKLVA
jgi:chromosome segregation ATPase